MHFACLQIKRINFVPVDALQFKFPFWPKFAKKQHGRLQVDVPFAVIEYFKCEYIGTVPAVFAQFNFEPPREQGPPFPFDIFLWKQTEPQQVINHRQTDQNGQKPQ